MTTLLKYGIELLMVLVAGAVVFGITYWLGWWGMLILIPLGLLFGAVCVRLYRRFDDAQR